MERPLPEWMSKVKDTAKKTVSDVSASENVHQRRFVYLMSPRELEIVAKQVLESKNTGNSVPSK